MIDPLRQSGLVAESDLPAFVRTGHFRYESGGHGDTLLALDLLFADPTRLRHAADRLAERLRPHALELVVGPLVGGALVGLHVADRLGAAFAVASPRPTAGDAPPSYAIPAALHDRVRASRVAVVDDVVNRGAATLATVRAVEAAGGAVVAAGALLVRTPGVVDDWPARGLPVVSLAGLAWNVWSPADCPFCRSGIPIDPAP